MFLALVSKPSSAAHTKNKMTHTLDNAEITNLISNIIKFGTANQIADWLKKIPDPVVPFSCLLGNVPLRKKMDYRGYDLSFSYTVASGTDDVQTAVIQLRRQARFRGWRVNKRIFKFWERILITAYIELGHCFQLEGAKDGCAFILGRENGLIYGYPETKIDCEPYSPEQNDHAIDPLEDFIIFQFDRNLRNTPSASHSPQTAFEPKDLSDFVLIPSGIFTMGDSLDGDTNAPPHGVYVSDFYMAKYETMKFFWDEVMNWGVSHGYADLPSGGGKEPNHPVHSINWYAIVKWCNALSEKEGLMPCYSVDGAVYRSGNIDAVVCDWNADGYRLPTEAEWEKAARGGLTGRRFPWGDSISHKDANFNNKCEEPYQHGVVDFHPRYAWGDYPGTSPVGRFPANGYGLHDMAGNVMEYCWDWHSNDYYASSPFRDPRGPISGTDRVNRGGTWFNEARYCRVADHDDRKPDAVDSTIGFRLAKSHL